MKIVTGMATGLVVGLITAGLGAYKDSPHEGFKPATFWRSPVIACIYGGLGAVLFPKNDSKILLAGLASTAERITVESWKATVEKKPGKFEWGPDRDRGWLKQGEDASACDRVGV